MLERLALMVGMCVLFWSANPGCSRSTPKQPDPVPTMPKKLGYNGQLHVIVDTGTGCHYLSPRFYPIGETVLPRTGPSGEHLCIPEHKTHEPAEFLLELER